MVLWGQLSKVSANLPGIACSLPSPHQRRRSASDAVLAASLTECFFTTHMPCRQSWRGNRIAPPNPAVPTGLPLQSCCGNRIALRNPALTAGMPRCITSSSGLELFFPERRLVMESAPLSGLGHVVDADDEGQAAREECVSQLRVKDQLSYRSSSCCGRGKCKEGQRRCTGAPGRAERVDMPARPGTARSRCTVAAGDAARCSVPVTAAVRRSPTSPRSCCAAGRTRRRPGARHGLSARPAEGARSRSACPPCAPPGAARSAGRPGLASSSSGAGLRRARRRRRRAPPGPGAGRRGSTPAFQNRRRESEARRRPPAAGPGEELTTLCFQSTSAAYQPFGLSLKTLGAQCCTALRPQTRRPDCAENTGSASVHTDALPDSRIARKTPPASCCVAGRSRKTPAVRRYTPMH